MIPNKGLKAVVVSFIFHVRTILKPSLFNSIDQSGGKPSKDHLTYDEQIFLWQELPMLDLQNISADHVHHGGKRSEPT